MSKPSKRPRPIGAYGLTEVAFTPQQRRAGFDVDVRNCLHCGVHHASLTAEIVGDRLIARCPSLGARPITVTFKLFIHPYP